MKTRDLIIESYLFVTSFALFGVGMFSLLGYLVYHQVNQLSVMMLPDSAVGALLMSGLLLSTIRQARSIVLLFAALIMSLCIYSLIHNFWAGSADAGQSWITGFKRMRSELAVVGITITLATCLSLWCGVLARFAQVIGSAIVVLGVVSQLADFYPVFEIFRLGFKHASSNIANVLVIALGVSVFLLALPAKRAIRSEACQLPVTGFIAVLLACAMWYVLSLQNSNAITHESDLLLSKTRDAIVQTETERLALIERISGRWQSLGRLPPPRLWREEVSSYLRDFIDLGSIGIIDRDFTPVLHEFRDGRQQAWIPSFLADSSNHPWLEHSFREAEAHLSPIYHQTNGVTTAIIASRLDLPGRAPMLVVASLDISKTMQALENRHFSDLALRLYEQDKSIFNSSTDQENRFYIDVGAIDIPIHDNRQWRLISSMDRAHIGALPSYLPSLGLLLGLFLSGLLILSRRLLYINTERTRHMEALNDELKKMLAQQQSLQKLNQRIRQFSRDVLCSVDTNGRFIEISPSCEQMFGYTPEELMGQSFSELVLAEDREITGKVAASVLAGRTIYNFQNRYRHRDGSVINVLWAADGSESDDTLFCVAHDITPLVRAQTYAETHRDILNMIVQERSQPEILRAICLMVEKLEPDVLCSILLLDEASSSLHTAMAPSLPDDFNNAINGAVVGDKAGSCGTAAYRRELVIVENIETDPLWNDYRESALRHNLRACWSFPMMTQQGKVLGTFALYNRQPSVPNQELTDNLASAAQLATISITRALDRKTLQESEQRFRSLFTFNSDAIYSFDLDGNFKQANDATLELTGLTHEEINELHFSNVIFAEDLERTQQHFMLAQKGIPQRYEIRIVNNQGEQLHLDVANLPIMVDEQIAGVFGIAKNITESKKAEKQLRLFKRSVESSFNGIVIVDALAEDMPVTYVNAGFERITGYSSDEIIGRNCRFLQGNERGQPGLNVIRQGLVDDSEIHSVLRNFRKNGSPFWNDLYISPIHDDEGKVTHYVGIQNDISEERRYQEELSFNSSHDVLTGLPNRTLLQDRLSQGCQVSRRYERYIAVMFIDLDGFKQINDSNGHHCGDQILVEVSSRLGEQVRAGDTVARIGGDEFVVLLPDLAQEEDVLPVAERILLALSKPYEIDGAIFQTSASIGITLNDGCIENPMELIQEADMAMYKAKQEGRNNYQWFTNDLSQNVRERVDLRSEMEKAIENEDFELYYQPQIDGHSGLVAGMEALIRWRHTKRGFVSPMTFISLAEETGQIVPISLWVLDTACRQLRSLADHGMNTLSIAVNISPVHFRRKDFFESIVAALARYDLNPEQLELEITESVLLSDAERTIECLQKLSALGIGIALDDFGTGYSSLSYLKYLPISKVKIDRCFVTDIISDKNDAAIAQGIITMAHHLGIKVVAEGVEDEDQSAFLKKANCDQLQGYHFARPMPAEELHPFLINNRYK